MTWGCLMQGPDEDNIKEKKQEKQVVIGHVCATVRYKGEKTLQEE